MNRFTDWLWRRRLAELRPAIAPASLELPSGGRVLVIAPHCDDETLGCGGTLALLRRNQCPVRVAVVTNSSGGGTVADDTAAGITEARRRESREALAMLGVEDVVFLDEPDGGLSASRRFMGAAGALLDGFRPDWLFVPSVIEYHRDHVAAGLAFLSLWRRRGRPGRLFFYEVWSPVPATHIVDITGVMDLKKRALGCYATALRHGSYLSSAEGLAVYRGLNIGGPETRYAEAYTEIDAAPGGTRLAESLLRLRVLAERLIAPRR
jgi:LmbE family N-acetylglucosaminyl deacetylase